MCENGYSCETPKECKEKHEKWIEKADKYVPIGEKEHNQFLTLLGNGNATILLDRHFKKRGLERSVSNKDVMEVINYGWCIERNKTMGSIALVLLGYVGVNKRPLHVVINMIAKDKWLVITAYNPQSHAWKWSEFYNERVCFCNHEE